MRKLTALVSGAAISAAVMLSACTGAQQSNGVGLLPGGIGTLHRAQLPSGRVVYLTDFNNSAIDVLQYRTWKSLGTITNGISSPGGDWVDRNGNLYVANVNASTPAVTEYDPSENLIFTYSAGLTKPYDVTTDRQGHVYVADNDHVSEFWQGVNGGITCGAPAGLSGLATGVAVDAQGDVFITNTSIYSPPSHIVEYKGGLRKSRCAGTVLGFTLTAPFGLAFDAQGNLLVCDALAATVDIVAPPYTSITGTLGSGWTAPGFIRIDRANTLAYVTDAFAHTVVVLNYPSGSIVTTLQENVDSAVDSKNYVP